MSPNTAAPFRDYDGIIPVWRSSTIDAGLIDTNEQERVWVDDWMRETNEVEEAIAAAFLEAEVGDTYSFRFDDENSEIDIVYIDDRPGIREVRLEQNIVVWIVRERYVFKTTQDLDPLMLSWVGAGEAELFDVEVRTDDGVTVTHEDLL